MKRLKELRKNKKMSQMQLADALFLSQRTISSYENGINEPDIRTLKSIANYFGVTVDYLIEFDKKNDDFLFSLETNIQNFTKEQLLNIIKSII